MLEKTVINQQCEHALFRQHVDSSFESLRALVEHEVANSENKLRLELHALERSLYARISDEMHRLSAEQSARVDRLESRVDRVEGKIDRLEENVDYFGKWLVGAQVTTLAFVIGTMAQAYLG
jgi:hypothetical protein